MEEKIACEYYLLPDVEAVLLKIPWNLIQGLKITVVILSLIHDSCPR